MPITPSGRPRIMQAQSLLNEPQQSDVAQGDSAGTFSYDDAPSPDLSKKVSKPSDKPSIHDQMNKGEGGQEKQDLLHYLFEKMQDFGYEPRRIHEYVSEFVEEKIFPGNQKEVTLTIPDRYAGKMKRLSDKDIYKIVQDVQEKFDLNFTEAQRKDKKVIMSFVSGSSESEEDEEQEDQETASDGLDEIFGTPGTGGPKKKKEKKIFSHKKFVKESQDSFLLDLYKKLKNKGER